MPRDVGVLGAELLHQKLLGVWGVVGNYPDYCSILSSVFYKNAGKYYFQDFPG